ncbi:MAG: 5'-3' exonuclease H3TH domain-containing protein, partial [Rhodothermaceae bacterium]
MKKKFVVIDAMAIAYRSYFAFMTRPLTTSQGEPVSAVYGFVNQLFKIIEEMQPDYLAVATDSKEKTFRHEKYELYKSSRSEMPEDMIPQIYKIYEIIEAFNIPLYKLPGYEADDLIGAAVKLAEKENLVSYAITPDKDYVQLISENINLVKPGKASEKSVIIDLEKAREDYGFEPIQMIDYLALVGDSSDDIPGVAGVGPKTATPLIQEYGTVEEIYNNIDNIGKKGLQKKLAESKENAFLSKDLATIRTDIPYDFDIQNTQIQKPDFDKLSKIFTELEFKAFGAKLVKIFSDAKDFVETEQEEENAGSFDNAQVKYKLIKTADEAKNLLKYLEAQKVIVFDTETDSLDTFNLNLAGVSFCVKQGEAFFVATDPYKQSETLFTQDLSDRLPVDEFVRLFKKLFEDKNNKKVCQNGKYDIAVLESIGINLQGFYFDTMLASYVIDPDEKHGMDALSQKFLNYTPIPISELIGEKKDATKIFEADLQLLSDYACEDADITFRLYKKLEKEIKEADLEKLAYDVEFPLVDVLNKMERTGVRIDK